MNGQKTVDLTKGNVWKILLLYSLPLFGSAMVQQAYSLVDLLIVGNFASGGQAALTAIGEATIIINILLAFALGSNGGCSVIVAKYFGAKNGLKVRETVNTALVTFACLCAFLMCVGFGAGRLSLIALSVEEELLGDSLTYLYIYVGSLPFVFLYNLGCGICSALGDSKTPFIFLVISSVMNVGLDLLFVCAFHWDVAGAAWATLISQAISCVLTVIVLIKKLSSVRTELASEIDSEIASQWNSAGAKPKLFVKSIFKDLVATSVPIILQNSFVSFGNLFIMKKINLIGGTSEAATGFTTGFRLVSMANMGVGTMTNGLANFCSQNKAAGEYQRIKQGYLAVQCYAMITSLLFLTAFECFPVPLTNIFIDNPTPAAVEYSATFMRIVSAFLPTVCVKIVSDGAVRGCGGNVGFTVSTFTDLILRVIFVYVLVDVGLQFYGVCWAWAIGWSVSMFIALGFYIATPCLRKVKCFGTQKDKSQSIAPNDAD